MKATYEEIKDTLIDFAIDVMFQFGYENKGTGRQLPYQYHGGLSTLETAMSILTRAGVAKRNPYTKLYHYEAKKYYKDLEERQGDISSSGEGK